MIPFNQAHAQTIATVVQKMDNAYVIETKGWRITYTDGVHPNARGAKLAGEGLATELKAIFGEDFLIRPKNEHSIIRNCYSYLRNLPLLTAEKKYLLRCFLFILPNLVKLKN